MRASLQPFLWGALTMVCAMTAVFFLRYWTVTRDRLLLYFALGFGVFAGHWAGFAIINPSVETRHYLYIVRLIAFLLIIIGIVYNNRRR
jgi:hypothetical protein